MTLPYVMRIPSLLSLDGLIVVCCILSSVFLNSKWPVLSYSLQTILLFLLSIRLFSLHRRLPLLCISVLLLSISLSLLYENLDAFVSVKNSISLFLGCLVFLSEPNISRRFYPYILGFFALDVLLTIVDPTFLLDLALNPEQVEGGRGGLFLNFHSNGFYLALFLGHLSLKRFILAIPSLILIYFTGSITIFLAFALFSLFILRIPSWIILRSLLRYSQVRRFLVLAVFCLPILLIAYFPGYVMNLASLGGKSGIVIAQQIVDFRKMYEFIGLLPGDISDLYDPSFSSFPDLNIPGMVNEIQLYNHLVELGILSFVVIVSFMLTTQLPFSAYILITISSLHYSYLGVPLSFVLLSLFLPINKYESV